MQDPERAVGITTTIPVEAVYAAGLRPVDLNNVFITSDDPAGAVREAEHAGFPQNICSWIKGIYTAARTAGLKRVIAVARGDCSNTHALAELLESEGVEIVDFSFPYRRDPDELQAELRKLCGRLGTSMDAAEETKRRLDRARRPAHEIDRLTCEEQLVSGEENHLWLVNTSDFRGDPERYADEARAFIAEARRREPRGGPIRIGVAGIPPICSDLYARVEEFGGTVVFNEMQRQFSMPYETETLLEQYLRYTYPYDIFFRLDDIVREIERRRVAGIIHYVQSFCFRSIQDRLLRRRVGVPILTLECDRPGPLDARSRTRVEAFMEMLGA
jgi:benzoyl-CoA reductase/2-hydroxyglutaryl-CoA dehydratase subunit BcrC/BadD/HgdB